MTNGQRARLLLEDEFVEVGMYHRLSQKIAAALDEAEKRGMEMAMLTASKVVTHLENTVKRLNDKVNNVRSAHLHTGCSLDSTCTVCTAIEERR